MQEIKDQLQEIKVIQRDIQQKLTDLHSSVFGLTDGGT